MNYNLIDILQGVIIFFVLVIWLYKLIFNTKELI